jgi:WD40 repeat protein
MTIFYCHEYYADIRKVIFDVSHGVGSLNGDVRMWDSVSGAELFLMLGHTDTINSVAFSPKGTSRK